MVAARAREFYEAHAKERMAEGGKAAGRGRPQQGKENLPYPIDAGQARDKAGKAAGGVRGDVALAEAIPDDVADAIADSPVAETGRVEVTWK